MISTLFGTAEAAVARTLIGGDVISDTRNELLKQIIVAVANKTSGGGAGTVTSVSFTGGLISVADPTGAAALTVAGTSGGIPYFDSASTWATSAALAANALLIGGGAGAAPASTTTGTGVLTALGVNVGSVGAFVTNNVANTFTALQTITQGTANAGVLASTGYSLTGSNATSMIDLAGTWNTTGAPTAIKLNLTDSASNAASLLMDLQLGGLTKFKVGKSQVFAVGNAGTSPQYAFIDATTTGVGRASGPNLELWASGNKNAVMSAAGGVVQTNIAGVLTVGPTVYTLNAFLTGPSTGTLQLGLDAAGVTDQFFTAASRITSDGVGANLTLAGGNGRGGAGGTLILSTYDTAGAATIGTLRSRMTFDTAGAVAFPVVTAVTAEVVVSDTTWPVTINGTAYKICLKA